MTQEPEDQEPAQPDDKLPQAKPTRKVAKTMLDSGLPTVKSEKPAGKPAQVPRKVARTMLETALPNLDQTPDQPLHQTPDQTQADSAEDISIQPSQPAQRVAKTMMDTKRPDLEKRQNFVAKTRLDLSVLAETVLKFETRKEARSVEEAKQRATQPIKEFQPVDGKKLAQTCPWTWDDDDSKDKFRHCPKCQTPTYNFEGVELSEAESLIFTRENKKEPTLYKRADGKFMTQDCPVQVKRKQKLAMVVVAVVVASAAMILLMPPPPPSPSSAYETSTPDATEEKDRTRTGALANPAGGFSGQSAMPIQPSANGTAKRKRPTFSEKDTGAYWE